MKRFNSLKEDEWFVFQTTSVFNSFIEFSDEIQWLNDRYDDSECYSQKAMIFWGRNDAFVRLTCFDDVSFDSIVEFGFKSQLEALEFQLTFA
jgi:hypothetical protein